MSNLDTYCSVNVKATANVLILKILDTGLSDAAALLLPIYLWTPGFNTKRFFTCLVRQVGQKSTCPK